MGRLSLSPSGPAGSGVGVLGVGLWDRCQASGLWSLRPVRWSPLRRGHGGELAGRHCVAELGRQPGVDTADHGIEVPDAGLGGGPDDFSDGRAQAGGLVGGGGETRSPDPGPPGGAGLEAHRPRPAVPDERQAGLDRVYRQVLSFPRLLSRALSSAACFRRCRIAASLIFTGFSPGLRLTTLMWLSLMNGSLGVLSLL